MRKLIMICVLTGLALFVQGQPDKIKKDSVRFSATMDSVTVNAWQSSNFLKSLPGVNGTFLFSGKKTEMITVAEAPADISNKTGRQVFAKIPGVFVYDMDGSGNQVNIATRGLDPHRGWEFNIRKDGILTNSDMYGYPASHYSMPLESIERIEIVRGTGSLQYGAQFGGMLNYVSKSGDTTRPFSFQSINTLGSFDQLSTYNAIGGKAGKLKYYAYYYRKSRDGYRDFDHSNAEAQSIMLQYQFSPRVNIRAEWSRATYVYRMPGQLNDSMFNANPRQATRTRNYFNPDIHVPSFTLNWKVSPTATMQWVMSAVLGKRNSVMFDKPANIADTINTSLQTFNNRQVDIDGFNSYTSELRWLQYYTIFRRPATLATGIQYMHNNLHRQQLGKGTTGTDFDLSLVTPGWGRDMHFKTNNFALYAEQKIQLSKTFSMNAGFRVESGRTDMSGVITYYPSNEIPLQIKHQFPLFGVNLLNHFDNNSEIYAGWSTAYRPMIFKDLIPASVFEKVDPNIKDAKGFNAEAGYRGSWKFLRWDISAFLLRYNNRFGTIAETDNNGNFYTYRTNTGNSLSKGIECFVSGDWLIREKFRISVFTSTAIMHARYTSGSLKSGNSNVALDGNHVEAAPDFISRNGFSLRYRKASFSVLYSYTAKSFADPLNTVTPPAATGAVGVVPGYGLLDMNVSFRITPQFEIRCSGNNLANKQYFTKRPLFYPGPGIWSSDGRSANITLMFRL